MSRQLSSQFVRENVSIGMVPIADLTYGRSVRYSLVMPITGQDLRTERRRSEITVTTIAALMGVSRQTVHALEKSIVLTPDRELQYRRALAAAIAAASDRVA